MTGNIKVPDPRNTKIFIIILCFFNLIDMLYLLLSHKQLSNILLESFIFFLFFFFFFMSCVLISYANSG